MDTFLFVQEQVTNLLLLVTVTKKYATELYKNCKT